MPDSSLEQIKNLATEIFNEFSLLQGSEQIAREDALRKLGEVTFKNQITSVLEIGSGIGTVAAFFKKLPVKDEIFYTCFESNEWCQVQLIKNVGCLHVLRDLDELIKFTEKIDLLIIDDFIDEGALSCVLKNVQPKFVFVEGHRRIQRFQVIKLSRNFGWKMCFQNFRKTDKSKKVGCLFEFHVENNNFWFAFFHTLFSLMLSKLTEIRASLHLKEFLRIKYAKR